MRQFTKYQETKKYPSIGAFVAVFHKKKSTIDSSPHKVLMDPERKGGPGVAVSIGENL